jgi:hypothetical protein
MSHCWSYPPFLSTAATLEENYNYFPRNWKHKKQGV